MLAAFRRSVRSWAAALILFLALVALVVTGFGTGGFGGLGSLNTGPGSTALASVDGRELTEAEASDILNRQYALARQQQPELDMAAFLAEAFDPLVEQLILGLAVQAFGEEQGLVVSQRMVDREIVSIPAFRNFAGQFDENAFRRALAQQNVTEAQLREDIARSLMQRQLLGPVARGASVPEGLALRYADLLLERRRGAIGVVPAEAMRAGIEPTPAEIAAFYQRNRGRFAIPERRVVQYAMIGPEQAAAAARATEEEIAAFYRANAAAFGPRERRDLLSIVLPDQAAAQAFARRVRGGASFADAAAEAGFSAEDLAFSGQSREQFAAATAPQVAEAAFAAGPGALVGPIRGELGFHLVRVESVERTPARPLAAVRDEIARAIEQRKRADALNALIERVEDRLADGASLEEAARAERLEVVTTPPITAAGVAPGMPFSFPGALQPLLRAAFEIDAEEPEPAVEEVEANRRYALVGVERVIPAAPPPLDQIAGQVREALIQQRALLRAREVARRIAARIDAGAAPAAAFAAVEPRLPAPESVNLQRLEISRAGEQAPPPLLALFSLAEGRAHVLAAPNDSGWFVVHHAERTPGDARGQPELVATTRAEFASRAAEEIAQQFARAIERAAEVERRPDAIAAARRRLAGGAAVD